MGVEASLLTADATDSLELAEDTAIAGIAVEAAALMRRLVERGATLVIVTHELHALAKIVTRTVVDADDPGVDRRVDLGDAEVVADLVDRRLLRCRPTGWFWAKDEPATDQSDIRGSGGGR